MKKAKGKVKAAHPEMKELKAMLQRMHGACLVRCQCTEYENKAWSATATLKGKCVDGYAIFRLQGKFRLRTWLIKPSATTPDVLFLPTQKEDAK